MHTQMHIQCKHRLRDITLKEERTRKESDCSK